jgi:DNA-3-methyladenine glycosylase
MGSTFAAKALYGLGRGDDGSIELGHSVRIGISQDKDRLLRFYLRHSPFVSGLRSLQG